MLIDAFGSLSAVLAAPRTAQLRISGNDTAAVAEIDAFRAAMLHALRQEVEHRPVIANDQALYSYLASLVGYAAVEHVVVLFLNARNVLIADAIMAVGTVDAVHVHIRDVIARALDVGATGLILVHNHPSGDPTPTGDDLTLTRSLALAAGVMDIRLVDHVIVASSKAYSFRREGLLPCK